MQRNALLQTLVILLSLAAGSRAQLSLSTGFSANNGESGNMFDILPAQDITICSLDLNLLPGTHTIELYHRVGSHAGVTRTPGAWNLVHTATVTSATADQETAFPLPVPLSVPAGQSALYITATAPVMRYTTSSNWGGVLASDDNLTILEGVGNVYPFGFITGFATPGASSRLWNGTINYVLGIQRDWRFNPGNDRWYRLTPPVDLSTARRVASSWHGQLATIRNAADQNWLAESFGSTFRIGLSDEGMEGTFVWDSGEPVTYTNWEPGQPDGANPSEDSVVFRACDYVWSDVSVSALLPALVEVEGNILGVSSFECDSPGFIQGPTCEGWTVSSTFSGHGEIESGNSGFPIGSSNLRITPQGFGPASPSPMPGGPSGWPYAPLSVGYAQLPIVAAAAEVIVDYRWTSFEGGSGALDFGEVLVIDAATNTVIASILRIETPNGSGRQTARGTIPAAYVGQPVIIAVVAGNRGNGTSDPTLRIDDLRFGLPQFPGSGEDIELYSGVSAAPIVSRTSDAVVNVPQGSALSLGFATPQGTFNLIPTLIAASLLPIGQTPTMLPGLESVHFDPRSFFILLGGGPFPALISSTINRITLLMPASLVGQTLIVQTAVVDPSANNGLFAVSNAHRFNIVP